ncbi:MAG: HPr family phosphocarrier protein [Holosporales bacterium]|jgi:phosphotransferase system HPr-like phosphotransfer protein|nr:HPr family phosphocarrier protein [Holosporales bacterium]
METGHNTLHFVVTKPFGMHARVCLKWVKALREVAQGKEGAFWIVYEGKRVVADSLLELLGQRMGKGAEFDFVYEPDSLLSEQQKALLHEKLQRLI